MKSIINFEEFSKFEFRCGEVKEIRKGKIIVDIDSEDLIICDRGNLKFNEKDKVIILLNGSKDGRILVASDDDKENVVLLTVEKDIENGSKIG